MVRYSIRDIHNHIVHEVSEGMQGMLWMSSKEYITIKQAIKYAITNLSSQNQSEVDTTKNKCNRHFIFRPWECSGFKLRLCNMQWLSGGPLMYRNLWDLKLWKAQVPKLYQISEL